MKKINANIIKELENIGYYKYFYHADYISAFGSKFKLDGLDCESNGKPPQIHVHIASYPEYLKINDRAEVFIQGSMGGTWCNLNVYSLSVEDLIPFLKSAKPLFELLWKAYADGMRQVKKSIENQ